jgi:hypothetical protein
MKHKKTIKKNKNSGCNNNNKDKNDNIYDNNNILNNSKDDLDLVEDTYRFLEDINNKLSEIKKIKTNRINGIIDLEISSEIIKNKNNKIPVNNDDEICIIYEDKFDLRNLCYEKNHLKLEKFNPNLDCIICFKKIIKKFENKCNHKFCMKCGNKWKQIKETCPVCILPI